jgi:hypothetical protein
MSQSSMLFFGSWQHLLGVDETCNEWRNSADLTQRRSNGKVKTAAGGSLREGQADFYSDSFQTRAKQGQMHLSARDYV